MTPIDRYENIITAYELRRNNPKANKAYLACKIGMLRWKLGQINKAKAEYKTAIIELEKSLYKTLPTLIKIAEFKLLLNPEKGLIRLQNIEKELLNTNKKLSDYTLGCFLISRVYIPIDPEKGLAYLNAAENSYFNCSEKDTVIRVIFNCKFLAKSYAATNQADKCIEIVKKTVENHFHLLNPTETAWTLLKLVRIILPLDTDYAKTLLHSAIITISPLNDKVVEKELRRVRRFVKLIANT